MHDTHQNNTTANLFIRQLWLSKVVLLVLYGSRTINPELLERASCTHLLRYAFFSAPPKAIIVRRNYKKHNQRVVFSKVLMTFKLCQRSLIHYYSKRLLVNYKSFFPLRETQIACTFPPFRSWGLLFYVFFDIGSFHRPTSPCAFAWEMPILTFNEYPFGIQVSRFPAVSVLLSHEKDSCFELLSSPRTSDQTTLRLVSQTC